MSQAKIRNICLSVISVFCLSSEVHLQPTQGLKYFLEIPYFIQNNPNFVGFLIFETLCLGRSKTLGIFTHYWRPFMSELLYFHQTFTDCVPSWCTHFDVNMPNVTAGYERFSDLISFFLGIIIYYYMFETL